MKRLLLLLIVFYSVMPLPIYAQNPFSPAQGFNVFLSGDASLSSNESEGPIAMGGNLTVNGGYQVNIHSNGTFKINNTLIGLLVGGTINYTTGTLQLDGNSYLKIGNCSGSKVWYTDNNGASSNIQITPSGASYGSSPNILINDNAPYFGSNISNANPICDNEISNDLNFSSAFTAFNNSSACLNGLSGNAVLSNPNGNVTGSTIASVLTGGQLKITLSQGVNVLNCSGSDLNSVTNGITFNNSPDANHILVINVNASGSFTWNVWNQAGISGSNAAYIIYNFPNTTSLNIAGNSTIEGCILAPNASIIKSTNPSNIEGQIVAASFTQTSGEVHYYPFAGSIPCSNSVPAVDNINCPSSFKRNNGNGQVVTTFASNISTSSTYYINRLTSNNQGTLTLNWDAAINYPPVITEVWINDVTPPTVNWVWGNNSTGSPFNPPGVPSNNQVAYTFYNNNLPPANNLTIQLTDPSTGKVINTCSYTGGSITPVIAAPTVSVTQPTCSVATGTITVTAPAGTGITYSIDGTNYQSSVTFNSVAAGTYSVYAKNNSGNISTATTATINAQPATPAVPTVSVTQSTCSVATGTITVTAPTGMNYSIDGITYTNTTGIFNNVSTGTYTVYAKNASGCISTTTATINAQPATPAVPTVSVTQPTCSVATGTITVTAPTGMNYSIDGTTYTNTTGVFSSVASGSYTVYAKNTSGCISTSTVTINAQPATPVVPTVTLTQPTCSVATGSIIISAPTGMNYSIDGTNYQSGLTFSNVTTGTYTVYAKNASGCISAKTATINAQPATPAVPTVSVTQPTCSVATGTITISPVVSGITYSIDGTTYTNTTGIFSNVSTGTYTVYAKNTSGCVSTKTATINAQPATPIVPTVTLTQPTCSVATGTITVTAPTGMNYSIDGTTYTNTTGVFSNVASGSYTVYAKNTSGCISTTTATINAQPATPAVPTVTLTQPTCSVVTGTITVTAPTGMNYSIDGTTYTNTTGIFNNVSTGTYTVYAKNASGCISTASATINAQPATPAVPTVTLTQPTCSVATGTITVTAPTGMTYSIDGTTYTNTTGIFNNVSTGTYTVYAKNASGCISTTTATINAQPATPAVPTVSVTQPTCSVATGTITVTAPTGMNYSIDGTTYTNGLTFSGLASGTYTVYAKNTSGCISTSTATINAQPATPAIPTVTITQPTCSVTTGTITVTAPTGMNYSIDGITYTNTTGIFSNVSTGTYTVYAKNASGCISTTSVTINAQPATPAAIVSVTQPTCSISTGTITVSVVSGTGITYSIDGINYQNSGIFSGLTSGNYTVYAKNLSGCISAAVNVLINTVPTKNSDFSYVSNATTQPLNGNSFSFTAGGTATGDSFSWNFGDGTSSTQANPIKSYSNFGIYNAMLIAKSTGGCIDTSYTSVVVTPASKSMDNIPVCGSRNAATITQTIIFPKSFTDWSGPALKTQTAAQFDPTSGTLLGVKVINKGSITTDAKVEVTGNMAAGTKRLVNINVQGSMDFAGPGFLYGINPAAIIDTFSSTGFDGIKDFAGTSGKDFGLQTSGMTDSTIFTDASLLNLYKGNGTVNLTAYTSTQFSASIPTGNDTMAIQTTAIDTAILVYYYCIPSTSSTTNISVCASAMPYSWNNNAYTSAGSYTITLTNSKGGDSLATLNLTVKPISTSTTNYTVCATALPYIWNNQTYNSAGTYTVHLTNSEGCDSAATLILKVNQPSSSTTNTVICSTLLPYSWNGQSYAAAGTYTVHLTNAAGCDSAATLVLTVNSAPAVSPINGASSVITGKTITLTDATAGGQWGSLSTRTATIDNNGVVTGVALGTDTITYSFSNSCGITEVKYAVYVNKPATDSCNNLTAGFTLNQRNQCISGNNYVFTNTTTGGTGPFIYNWDFNDGNHSAVMNPVHVYSQPSDHDISLTVTDAKGCQSGYVVQITVGPEPVPSFNTAFNTYDSTGTTFNSTSSIAAGNMTYYWNLGNGTSSTLINPMVVYNPGTYLVTLVVTGSGGCVDSVKELVNISNKTISIIGNVGLINGLDSVCKGAAIQLTDTTKTGVWSSLNTAVATVSGSGLVTGVSAGNVQINYTVTNSYGVFTANTIITVTGPPSTPLISGNTSICLGTDASFTANGTGGVWSSTNTNVATVNKTGLVSGLAAGTSEIAYTLNNGCGLAAATSTVTVAKCAPCTLPVVAAISGQTQVTPGATIQLSDNTANGVWASGNTAIITVDNTGKVTGIAAGSTTVTYTVTNNCGSTVSSVTITCSSAFIPPTKCTLVAKFSVNNTAQCITDNKFVFTDASTGGNGTLVYNWDFNDGNHSTDQNPVHVYSTAADHDISLTVTDGNGCTSGASVQITVGSVPSASFTVDYNTGTGTGTTFLSTSTIASGNMTYFWDLGDGTTSDLSNPTVYYTKGDYKVKLVVSGIGDCKDSVSDIIKYDGKVPVTIKCSPNPATTITNISFTNSGTVNKVVVKVFDGKGKLVLENSENTTQSGTTISLSLNLNGLPSGTYYVIILDENNDKIGSAIIIKN